MVDYSHIVVGGGVVGLAIAARLSRAGYRVLICERNSKVGQETSARNSEVVHGGLYYPSESLKMRLCLRGKELIYDAVKTAGLSDVKQCGKWLVAQNKEQLKYLEKLKNRGDNETGVPLHWVSLAKARFIEPAVITREAILESPTTGILSAHSLMDWLEAQIQAAGGDIATHTNVTGIETKGKNQFTVTTSSGGESLSLSCESVVNAAGHGAPAISNMVMPDLGLKAYYAKGSYFSYGSSQPKVSRLIYPCPSDHGSLGTHLTLDLGGRLKFGPDFEWVDSPDQLAPSSANLDRAKQAISEYIKLDTSQLVPDYAGIRPKLSRDVSSFHDFEIRQDLPGFINLLAIESPGLTSSLAIAEYVHENFF